LPWLAAHLPLYALSIPLIARSRFAHLMLAPRLVLRFQFIAERSVALDGPAWSRNPSSIRADTDMLEISHHLMLRMQGDGRGGPSRPLPPPSPGNIPLSTVRRCRPPVGGPGRPKGLTPRQVNVTPGGASRAWSDPIKRCPRNEHQREPDRAAELNTLPEPPASGRAVGEEGHRLRPPPPQIG